MEEARKGSTPSVLKVTLAVFKNETLKEHLWPQARCQLKKAWTAYISEHFAQSSSVTVRLPNGFTHKPASFAILMLVSHDSDATQWTVLWNSF